MKVDRASAVFVADVKKKDCCIPWRFAKTELAVLSGLYNIVPMAGGFGDQYEQLSFIISTKRGYLFNYIL